VALSPTDLVNAGDCDYVPCAVPLGSLDEDIGVEHDGFLVILVAHQHDHARLERDHQLVLLDVSGFLQFGQELTPVGDVRGQPLQGSDAQDVLLFLGQFDFRH